MRYMSSVVTRHGAKRAKQRMGLNTKSVAPNAEKAWEYGVTHAETKGQLKKYIDKLYFCNRSANNIRIYHRFVYIFCDHVLVTVFALPREFNEIADKLQQKKNAKLASEGEREGNARAV